MEEKARDEKRKREMQKRRMEEEAKYVGREGEGGEAEEER